MIGLGKKRSKRGGEEYLEGEMNGYEEGDGAV